MAHVITYLRTTRDIVNPKPDRRKKDDWRMKPVIPAGISLQLREWTRDNGQGGVDSRQLVSGRYAESVNDFEDLFALVMAATEPRTPTLRERLDAANVSAEEVLEYIGVSDEQLVAAEAHATQVHDEDAARRLGPQHA